MRVHAVSAAVGAIACSAAISAWRRYGAGGAPASGVSSSTASSISVRCHRDRSWSASSTSSAGTVDPRIPAGVLQQHQRQQGVQLGVRRRDLADHPGQPDRVARQLRTVHVVTGRRGVGGGEGQVGDVGREPDPRRQLRTGRAPRTAAPASRLRARVSRAAMVGV